MLKLDVNREKQLTFEVQIGGVQSEQVSSHLRIEIDDVEYGFPAEIGRESITVNLPALRTVTARKLKEGEEVNVKLEIIADGNYLTPWQDTFRLSNPLVIEAKIVDDEFRSAPAFKTKLVTEGKFGEQKQGVRLEKVEESTISAEDALTERIVNKLTEKLSGTFLGESEEVDEFVQRPGANRPSGGFGSIKGKSTQGGFGSIKGREQGKKLPSMMRREEDEDMADEVNDEDNGEEEVKEFIQRPGANRPSGGFGSIKGKSTQGGFGSIKGKEAKKLPSMMRREEDEDMADEVNDEEGGEGVEEFIQRTPEKRPAGGFGSIKGKSTEGGFGSIKGREKPKSRYGSPRRETVTPEDVMNIDEAGVYAYIERAGTKNPVIQRIIYEQAEAAAGSSVPVRVLQQVVKIMKSKK